MARKSPPRYIQLNWDWFLHIRLLSCSQALGCIRMHVFELHVEYELTHRTKCLHKKKAEVKFNRVWLESVEPDPICLAIKVVIGNINLKRDASTAPSRSTWTCQRKLLFNKFEQPFYTQSYRLLAISSLNDFRLWT